MLDRYFDSDRTTARLRIALAGPMLVVRVELHSAVTGVTTEIARMHIINEGSGDVERGNYTCQALRGRDSKALDARHVQRHGAVTNYPRLNLHVWNLVSRALKSMKYG